MKIENRSFVAGLSLHFEDFIFAIQEDVFTRFFESCEYLADRSFEDEIGRIIAGESTAADIEELSIGYAIDREGVARLDIIRVDDECGDTTNLPS